MLADFFKRVKSDNKDNYSNHSRFQQKIFDFFNICWATIRRDGVRLFPGLRWEWERGGEKEGEERERERDRTKRESWGSVSVRERGLLWATNCSFSWTFFSSDLQLSDNFFFLLRNLISAQIWFESETKTFLLQNFRKKIVSRDLNKNISFKLIDKKKCNLK